ncbi:glycosyltransferase [Mucisphaera sp.]|uniref:glycosyltransferase n=1 Tax=Mucisphaera sp. TaxID=2913024 RepID=UPI003D0AC536
MVDGGFRERFESIDYLANQDLPREDYELIWVEHGSQIHDDLQGRLDHQPNFRAITLGRSGTYHASYCFNRGITEARGDILVIIDADVITEPCFLSQILEAHRDQPRLALYCYRYNEAKEDHRDEVDINHLKRVTSITNPSNHGACLSIRKTWIEQINGYDQHPIFATGFHANCLDVYTRLKVLGIPVSWHPEIRLYHPWHPSTAEHSVNYQPQVHTSAWRARNLKHLPFRGLDVSHDTDPPEGLLKHLEWVRQQWMPWHRRIKHKVVQRLRLAA